MAVDVVACDAAAAVEQPVDDRIRRLQAGGDRIVRGIANRVVAAAGLAVREGNVRARAADDAEADAAVMPAAYEREAHPAREAIAHGIVGLPRAEGGVLRLGGDEGAEDGGAEPAPKQNKQKLRQADACEWSGGPPLRRM